MHFLIYERFILDYFMCISTLWCIKLLIDYFIQVMLIKSNYSNLGRPKSPSQSLLCV